MPKQSESSFCDELRAAGWEVHVAQDLKAANRMLREHACLVGLFMPAQVDDRVCEDFDKFLKSHGSMEWVGAFTRASLALPVCRDLIVDHMFDHHTLPIDPPRLIVTLGHAWGHACLRRVVNGHEHEINDVPIVGDSTAVKSLMSQIRRVAKVEAPVLICGESGSGKELTAQAIHKASSRAGGPFVPVNCGAIPATLIQSELFGHAKGAFTGAARDERGLIEAASGGTIFLDEIGDLSLDLQINLLRFLQEKTINRVGSTRSIQVDVRVIAATNVDLEAAVAAGTFREDLFYRLNVLPINVPPLRERRADVETLARHFFAKFASDKSPRLKGFSRRALIAMEAHAWPGNVRELINRIRRAMVMAEGRLITPADLGLEAVVGDQRSVDALDEARTEAERSAIFTSLQNAGKNITQAARQLGISRMTLYRLMAKHGINH
jgi:DNA-binding NtrC family response regulator